MKTYTISITNNNCLRDSKISFDIDSCLFIDDIIQLALKEVSDENEREKIHRQNKKRRYAEVELRAKQLHQQTSNWSEWKKKAIEYQAQNKIE